jgi:tRNA(Ile)-lysidine synthase
VPDDPFLLTLAAKLNEWPSGTSGPFAVALSGGLDSTVLLAALQRLQLGGALRALHVDHGLHADSAQWAQQCRDTAQALGVRYDGLRVSVDRSSGMGLEAAARNARYRALRELVAPGETLVTAHHADDQLETVLLRMRRGSGVRGLRGIVEHASFGAGYLARPLLGCSRADLREQAERWQLRWLEDPANHDVAHDRNYLRLHVVPQLTQRWPAAPRMAQRLARQMAEAEAILEAAAADDARFLPGVDRVPRAVLAALDPDRQRNLLRFVLRRNGLGTPSARQLQELVQSLLVHRRDAQPRVAWPGGEGRVYRDCLYLLRSVPGASDPGARVGLKLADHWSGPEGRVAFAPAAAPGLPQTWLEAGLTLRFRIGGERFRPLGRTSGCSLKRWLQEQAVVPWMRGRLPLLFRGEQLVAVADLVLDDSARSAPDEPRWRVVWTDHPPVR